MHDDVTSIDVTARSIISVITTTVFFFIIISRSIMVGKPVIVFL